MAQTVVEKIISRHAGATVHAGDMAIASVDAVMATDGNAPLAIRLLREQLGAGDDFDASKVILVIDHGAPAPTEGAANLQSLMRSFAQATGALLYEAGSGISHVVLPEQGHARPGGLVVGSDSHTVTYGAVNCLGTGMGSTDIAVAMYTGKVWLRVPETIRVELSGRLPAGVTAKDLTLWLVRQVGVDGATYKCLEIAGDGLAQLDMDGRFTMTNMSVEMGAKCALMPLDEVSGGYLAERLDEVPPMVWSDPGCRYESTVTLELGRVEPLVAQPHDLGAIVPVADVAGERIDVAFLGTCTNGRISDLEQAAAVLRERRVKPGVRLIVTPGSRAVYLEALRRGLVETFVHAGAVVTTPGCGPCVGLHQGVPSDGEVVISTANRNFKGRMGNPRAAIFLASPPTVAASAVLGRVASSTEVA
jgi:3-isopropylmalate/(R)-2-methylmalate dehydratase large subunit